MASSMRRRTKASCVTLTNRDSETHRPQIDELRRSVADGLLYTHSRLSANQRKTLEAASFLYALVELLEEQGLIAIEELDARKQVVAERLAQQYQEQQMGVVFQDPEYDKYAFESEVRIDCDNRVHLCQAACCRLPFALSKQDVREGIVLWDLGQPYLIEHGADGYCSHLDRASRGCTIHAQRPVPCRGFDCRSDQRIWLDFAGRVPDSDVARADWLEHLARRQEQAEHYDQGS